MRTKRNVNESCEKPQRCSLTTVRLVCSILTVVLFVTGPAHGNTAAARTRKEVHRTIMLPFLCGKESERSISLCNITHFIFAVRMRGCVSACWCVKSLTGTVSFIWEVSTVIGAITAPGGGIAECCELAPLKSHALHSKQIVTRAVSGAWKRMYWKIVFVRENTCNLLVWLPDQIFFD